MTLKAGRCVVCDMLVSCEGFNYSFSFSRTPRLPVHEHFSYCSEMECKIRSYLAS